MNDLLNIMRALADPTRLRIVFLVMRLELSVGELVQILGQSQPRVSRHVRILDEASILERRKEGSWVFMRPGPVLVGRRLDALLAETDVTGVKAFQRDLTKLEEVRAARTEMAAAYFAAHASEWDSLRSLHVAEIRSRERHLGNTARSARWKNAGRWNRHRQDDGVVRFPSRPFCRAG